MALKFDITGDNSNLLSSLDVARERVRLTARDIEESGLSIEDMFKRIGAAVGVAFTFDQAKNFVRSVMETRGEFQKLEVAFTTMLQSEEKAASLMNQLVKTAAITPFDLKGVADGAKQLLAYGIAADEVNDTLVHLGDIAAGLSIPLGDLVYLYGTTMTQGRMFTQDLRQFQGRGIPIAEELAKQFGVAKDKVGELVTAGKVGAEQVKKALMDMSSEGGKFGGLMEEQAKTINGQISNIEDAIDVMFNNIGKQNEGIINTALSGVSTLIENYEAIGKAIASAVAVYGVYKAAIMTVTAMQALQTAGVGALTAAETIHYGWLVLVQKAQALLNATMLANPYVLTATAVAGLAAALIFLNDSTNAEQAATESLNNTMDELAKTQEEYNKKTEEAITIAQNDAAATTDRDEAMQLLIARYPEIIKKYIDEEGHLSNILQFKKEIAAYNGQQQRAEKTEKIRQEGLDAWNKYNRLATLRSRQLSAKNVFSDSERAEIEALRKQYKSERGLSWYNSASLEEMRDYYKAKASQGRKRYARNLTENRITDFTTEGRGLEKYNDAQLKALQKKLRDAQTKDKQKTAVFISDLQDYLTYTDRESLLTRVEGMISARDQSKSTPAQRKAALKKTLDDANKALTDFDNSSTKYTANEAEKKRKELLEAVDTAEKAYKAAGGKSSKSEQSDADKKKRNNEQANEMILRLRQQAEDDETAVIQEGVEKRIKVISDAYEKEKATIDKQEREIKEKRGGTLTGDDTKTITAARQAAHKKYIKDLADAQKEELSAMYSYLKEYGSFEQQKLAITEDYEQKIRDAQTKGEKLRLTREKDNKLANLSFESVSMGIDWSALLNGVGNLSQEMLKPMLKQLEAYTKTDAYRDASMEEREKVSELIDELRNYVGTDQSTTWEELAKAISNFTESVASYKEADKKEQEAVAARDEGKKKLERGEITQDDFDALDRAAMDLGDQTARAKEEMQHLGQTLNETSDKVRDYVSPLTTALNKAGTWAGVQGMDAVKGSVANIDALKGALDSALPSMGEGMAKTIGSGLSSALGSGLSVMGEGLSSVLSSGLGGVIGIVAQIPRLIIDLVGNVKSMITGVLDSITELISLRWIDDLVVSILDAVGNLIDAIFDLPENLFKVLEGIVVNGIGGLLNKVLGRIGNILSFGFLSSGGPAEWFENSNAKEVAETINRLTEENKNLEQAIEDLKGEMEKSRGAAAIDISRRAADYQKQTNENYKQMAQAQAGYHGSHHSWNYYWDGYSQEQINRLSNQIGRQWNGDIWDLSPEEMKMLRSNVDMWNKISDTGKSYYGKSVQEKLNAYIDQAGKLQEITDALYENLTTTTKDNVFDDFLGSLYDLADGSEDVFDNIADEWQKMVNKMVINNLIGDKFKEKLDGWYEELAKLNESKTDGEITDEEYRKRLDALKAQYEGYVRDAERDVETLRNEGIIKATDDSEYKQEASSKGFNAMSQDTGEELNGRFTALQISGDIIAEQIISIYTQMITMTAIQTSSNNCLIEIRNMMITGNSYLEDIAKYSKKIYIDFATKLDDIITNTK